MVCVEQPDRDPAHADLHAAEQPADQRNQRLQPQRLRRAGSPLLGRALAAGRWRSACTRLQDEHEAGYLDALPSASMYERSFMHRDTVTHVAFATTHDFFVTASIDGHLKFWKKRHRGVEFVKHFRAHASEILGLSVSADGGMCTTIGSDNTCKIFDVVNFDMLLMLKLPYAPTACEFVFRRGDAVHALAIGDDAGTIRVYDALSSSAEPVKTLDKLHRSRITALRYNSARECVISAEEKGA